MGKIVVLYIIDTFVELAGAERNLYEIVTRLNKEKYQPIVFALQGGPLIGVLNKDGILAKDLKLKRIYGLKAFIEVIKLVRFINNKLVKIVVTYHESSDFWGGLIAKLCNVPVIISSRRDMGYKLKNRHFLFYNLINNLIFDKIITVSDAVKKMLIKKQNAKENKITTIYSGVDLERFNRNFDVNKIKMSLGLIIDEPVVGIFAALRPVKGHTYFLEAASIVLQSISDAKFLIVGWHDDNYFLKLKNLSEGLGISQSVIFTGGRNDTEEVLSVIDISVISSLSEGFSNTILETSAAGKPIVATNCGGNPEAIVDGDTGILVPPKDAKALAEAILYLLQNRGLAKTMGLTGRKRVGKYFSFQRMMNEIEEFYEALLEDRVLRQENTLAKLTNISKTMFRRLIKISLSGLLYYSGIIYLIRKFSKNNGITILAFHKISNDTPIYLGLNTSVSSFESQMRYLKRYYNLISLKKATQLIQNGERILDNTVVVTFDDGYKNNYTNAFPIIKKYDIPVTIFLTAGMINSKSTLWYEQIVTIINETVQKTLDFSSFGLGKFIIDIPIDKKNTISEIVHYAKGLNKSEQGKLIKFMSDKFKVNVDEVMSYSQMLSWEEINEMKNDGISFGSHGLTHTILSRLTLKEVEYEISESKKILENKLNMQIDTFAYPNGRKEDFNKEIISILKNNMFSSACTLIHGSNNTDLFVLKRKCINDELTNGMSGRFSKCLFATEMLGIFDLLKT